MLRGEVTIRPMEERDIPQIAALERENFYPPWSEDAYREEMKNPMARVFVAASDDTVAGYLGLRQVLDEASINNVAVVRQFRGRGLGKGLLEAALAYAGEHGAALLTLEVRASNTPAIRLYEEYGFKRVGLRRRFYHRPTEDAILYNYYF